MESPLLRAGVAAAAAALCLKAGEDPASIKKEESETESKVVKAKAEVEPSSLQ